MKGLHLVAFILLVVGGLNWLLVGAFSFDLVASLLGNMTVLTKSVYVLVGLSAIVEIFYVSKHCK